MTTTTVAKKGFANTRLVGTTTFLFVGLHLLAAAGVVHLCLNFSWWTLGLAIVWYLFCGLSITAGYHRLFSHRSYRASWPVRAMLLAFGAAGIQRSALKWCSDHRTHHRFSDEPDDPYSVTHGFWWAHFGWVISSGESTTQPVHDLERDPLVRFQHRHWLLLAILVGAVIPAGIALAWGDPLGGFLVAGCLRIIVCWHNTFAVNSVTHRFGTRPYSKKGTARDSYWVAFLTLGEGYHNFHHHFQSDYRNGIRWFQWDPTKWLIWTLSGLRLTSDLKRVDRSVIDAARANPVR